MPASRFELVDDKSAKYWEITQEGAEYTVCFGKIGTKEQSKPPTLPSRHIHRSCVNHPGGDQKRSNRGKD